MNNDELRQKYVNTSLKAVVTSLNEDNTVNIELYIKDLKNTDNPTIPVLNVPTMKIAGGSDDHNLKLGDNVVVMHLNGNIAKPVIIGKF